MFKLVRKIENGYCEYYYLTEDGKLYNAQTNEYKRFSNKAGLKVRDNRLRVEKGTSDLKKINARKLDDEQDYLKLKKEYDKEVKRVRRLEKEADELKSVDGTEYIFRYNHQKLAELKKLHNEIWNIYQELNKK